MHLLPMGVSDEYKAVKKYSIFTQGESWLEPSLQKSVYIDVIVIYDIITLYDLSTL